MTKEQKEAIEYLKKYKYDNEVYNAIKTVLSMLEEKDEQITEEQKAVEQIYEDYQDIGKIAFDYSDRIELLEKQIDVMAEAWKQDDIRSTKEIKEYFENKTKEYLKAR